MASTDARPVPLKNTAYRLYFAIRDTAGALVTTWAGQDSEVSLDGDTFADCTSEATEIGTSGVGYLDLTAAEMNADAVAVKITVTNTKAVNPVFVLHPEEAGDIRVTPSDGSITADAIATDAIDADAIKADAVTEIQNGLATAAALDAVDNFIDTEVAAILAAVDTEIAAIKAKTDNLPASPAAVGDAMTLTSAYDAAKTAASQTSVDDIPTVAEFEARTIVAANYATAANQTTIIGYVDCLPATWVVPAATGDAMTLTAAYDAAKTAASQTSVDDIPTVSEFNARTIAAADYATATSLATVDTVVDAIKVQTDKLNFTGTDVKATLDSETVAVADKTGFKLAADGLDSITATEPSEKPTTFTGWVMWLVQRFRSATMTATTLTVKTEAGATVTTQTISDDGITETLGAPS